MTARFHRAIAPHGRRVSVWLEGERLDAWEGESLLAVILTRRDSLPGLEFGRWLAGRVLFDGRVPGMLGADRAGRPGARLHHQGDGRDAHRPASGPAGVETINEAGRTALVALVMAGLAPGSFATSMLAWLAGTGPAMTGGARRIVIVGAGPAGMAAACILAEHGHRPVVLDEAERPGGQGYRLPGTVLEQAVWTPAGQKAQATRLHAAFAALSERIEHRPATLAWHVHDGAVHTLHRGSPGAEPFDVLILAAGATERLFPLPGWTLPGVTTPGGVQTLLKDQGCLVGRRVAFCGSSPLLYLAALQYVQHGAQVAVVLDTAPFVRKLAALPSLAAAPNLLARGLSWIAALRRHGVPIHAGAQPRRIEEDGSARRLIWADASGRERHLSVDAVALGFGLQSETQLAQLAGCDMRFDAVSRQFLPQADMDGRAGPGLFVAGDGAAIGGAEAAEVSGRLAAWALLGDLGTTPPGREVARLRTRLRRLRRFQRGLLTAFAVPPEMLAALPDDTIVCRCERIAAGTVRQVVRGYTGAADVNRVKALTRCGMGRCQGRFCAWGWPSWWRRNAACRWSKPAGCAPRRR